MQQPVMHDRPGAHGARQSSPHGASPPGHSGTLQVDVEPLHDAGSVRLPKQIWQASHPLAQLGTCVQGLQRVGSETCSESHDGFPASVG